MGLFWPLWVLMFVCAVGLIVYAFVERWWYDNFKGKHAK